MAQQADYHRRSFLSASGRSGMANEVSIRAFEEYQESD